MRSPSRCHRTTVPPGSAGLGLGSPPSAGNARALVEISRVALDEGAVPEVNGVRPHLQVSATLETLLGMPGAPAAELEGAGPISGEMLRRLAGDCSVRRVLLGEDSLVTSGVSRAA